MTDYYPYQNRKSLIEKCLLNAFKETWRAKENEVRAAINDGQISTLEKKEPYASFNLKQVNQNFELGESELFTNTTLLHANMYDIDSSNFYMETTSRPKNGKEISIKTLRFDDSMFDTTQINERMSYNDAIKLLHNLYISSPTLIYGALLNDGSKFINPLHPLIAQSFIKNNGDQDADAKMYRIIIYTYKDNLSESKNKFVREPKYAKLFTDHLLGILAMLDIKSNFGSKITSYQQLRDSDNRDDVKTWSQFKYNYVIKNIQEGSSYSDVNLQPVQLINNGLAVPYYGIVAEKYNENHGTVGYQLSPMLSCNVGYPYVNIFDDGDISVRSLNVCTGNYSNTSKEGRLSLNHANLNSPYFSDTMGTGSLTFAEVCVKMSLGIYAEFFDLERINFMPEEEPALPISFEEYKKLNPTSTLKKYLESIK